MYVKVTGGILVYIGGMAILLMACLHDLNAAVGEAGGPATHAIERSQPVPQQIAAYRRP